MHESVPNDTAYLIARALLDGFDNHYRLFRACSQSAKHYFEDGNWPALQQATRERIDYYDARVNETVERLKTEFKASSLEEVVWPRVKQHYINLLAEHRQPELAETFFNTVSCRILHRTYFHNRFIFVRPTISTEHMDADVPAYRCYYPAKEGLRRTIQHIVRDFELKRPFADLRRDIRFVLRAWRQRLPRPFRTEANHQIQVLSTLFYRNKGAYIVGKAINGNYEYPFVVPILHDAEGKLYLDTILLKPEFMALVFSATRAYFMVDMEVPSAYVQFLSSILPNKPKGELYTILGLQKHGKNLFYRDFLHHLRHSNDKFIIAPGIKGLVMCVFTLPSYPYVFKVIRDFIAPPKDVTRQVVKEKYLLVKHHDRVGRMADTLEYSDVAFPKNRFSEELFAELKALSPSLIEEEPNLVIVKHLYIERRMTPLNLFIDRAKDDEIRLAVREYGNAIKELAAANIFAGDLLFKNFGVTRYSRVVFYDYDEIDYLTRCNFRRIPKARTVEDEMSAEPWYSVGPHDVFPEEFEAFLLTDERVRKYFMQYHGDLLDPEYWKGLQKRIAEGYVEDVFPYPAILRFRNNYGWNAMGIPRQSRTPTVELSTISR